MIEAKEFMEYLNPESITEDTPDLVVAVVQVPQEYRSSVLIRSKQDHEEKITIDFSVKFEHRESQKEGRIFQRAFSIEHHPPEKSVHEKPHVQFHIHGANPNQENREALVNT